MNAKPRTSELINSLRPEKAAGSIVKINGDDWYKISNSNAIPPFFMTITSSSDVWNFIWSNGALSAGRKDANQAIFPYYTADKIDDMRNCTGSYSAVKIRKDGQTYFWEPFAENAQWKFQRNIYKNSAGSHIIFEEINRELNLTYKVEWTSSEKYGLVKIASIENTSSETVTLQILDGCRNIMPACTTNDIQAVNSVLVDAYKKTDLDSESGLALFSMSSVLTDRAEPSEALWANTCWFSKKTPVFTNPATPTLFAHGDQLQETQVLKGQRASCYISMEVSLPADAKESWKQVFDTKLEISKIESLIQELKDRETLNKSLEKDIQDGQALLDKYIADADGIQNTADKLACIHHKANVMFNIMRGGVFVENNTVHANDFVDFVNTRNKSLADAASKIAGSGTISYLELGEKAKASGNDQLYRLYLEYLPLSFSRRHGDPSRPWNKFSINLKDTLGNPILNYEGNWRDIFQNWEALAMSYPVYTKGMIAKFLNAVTIDGFNPYRITRNGLDWEIPEPNNPWANIGYWNDHQIIYLCKLLELQNQIDPAALSEMLDQAIFSTSNIPYRIKPYADVVKNPRDTIFFDRELNAAILADSKKYGTDAKLTGKDGNPYLVTLSAKLLQLILTKIANFVPQGGIWLNTQRPEWNDANNALAGYGLSMVTLYYLRRMMVFTKKLFENSKSDSFAIPAELKKLLDALSAQYASSDPASINTSAAREEFTRKAGLAFEAERLSLYADGSKLEETASVTKQEIFAALDAFIAHAEYSIRQNKRADGLYHSYNTLSVSDKGMDVEYLQEMLEGQVAVLSSGMLTAKETIELCDALKASKIYEPHQTSYMLYPTKELPMFTAKNGVSKQAAKKFPILAKELERGYTAPDADCIIYNDSLSADKCHFNPDFRNNALLADKIAAVYPSCSEEEKNGILALYEDTFNHKSFTGRSGTFYAYEGIGSIYWHMVSKLLLAVQENFQTALASGNKAESDRLAEIYYQVRNGLSFNKTPELYGAFPTDPYSHTPYMQGAKQPGMTGQVKEEVITRWGELGMEIKEGKVAINPALLCKKEFDSNGKLYFTRFGTEFEYKLADVAKCNIMVDGSAGKDILSEQDSKELFMRNGKIKKITVEIPESAILR